MKKHVFVLFICSIVVLGSIIACSYQEKPIGPVAVETRLCCDANDNCSPAPALPGVCPADTITTVCDENNNCEDEE